MATQYKASYNQRDLILYALSVGFGSSSENELKYLYEKHPNFVAVPTFCLALTFWAQEVKNNGSAGTSYEIPPFPPPTMDSAIPSQFLKRPDDISPYPVIHISQSVEWHQDLPVPASATQPIHTRLTKQILSVTPKSIGTFVTSETQIWQENNNLLLCTLQMTILVLGISPDDVIPLNTTQPKPSPKSFELPQQNPDFEWKYDTTPNQALLYRLASGDSNAIHVQGGDETMSKALGLKQANTPILHGLNTLGIAARAILAILPHYLGHDVSLERLEGRFTKPVLWEDSLLVKLWKVAEHTMVYVVENQTRGGTAVDHGLVQWRRNNRSGGPPVTSKL